MACARIGIQTVKKIPIAELVNGANAALYDTVGRMSRIGVRAFF
jgi:hypothetical protein